MIRSMTGFGRSEISGDKHKITVEIKSVNHRYLDLTLKMPRKFNPFEAVIRNELKQKIKRGKVDVYISYEDYSAESSAVKYNEAIAAEYLSCLKQMAKTFGLENDIRVSTLSRYPDVFSMEDQAVDADAMLPDLMNAVNAAADAFVDAKIREGEALKTDLSGKLLHMLDCVSQVEERRPAIVEEYRAQLQEKVNELLGDVQIDESRLATEIVIFADKICTDEETVRLTTHIHSMQDILETGEEIGRKLDFIAQEMNRESNTILSKSNDTKTTELGIELKTTVEKIREQIQNIE